MCSRCAIHFNVMMLSRLSRNAIFTFSGSPLRRFTRSASSISGASVPPSQSAPPSPRPIPAVPPHKDSLQLVRPFVPVIPSGIPCLQNTSPAALICIVQVYPVPAVVPSAAPIPAVRPCCPWGFPSPPATDPPATSRAACRAEPNTTDNCSTDTNAGVVPPPAALPEQDSDERNRTPSANSHFHCCPQSVTCNVSVTPSTP